MKHFFFVNTLVFFNLDDSDEEDNEMPVEKEASHSRSLNISEESEEDETLSNLTTLVDLSKHVKENGTYYILR